MTETRDSSGQTARAQGSHPSAPGIEHRRVYLDSVDEALRRSTPARAPRRPRRRIEDIATRQMRAAEKMARLQRKAIETQYADPDFVKAFNETTKSITNLAETLRRTADSERKAFGGLDQDQLDAVFTTQLTRIAPKLSEADKRVMIEIWFGEDVASVLLAPRTQTPAEADE